MEFFFLIVHVREFYSLVCELPKRGVVVLAAVDDEDEPNPEPKREPAVPSPPGPKADVPPNENPPDVLFPKTPPLVVTACA